MSTSDQALPSGRHGLPRELVLEHQRTRLLRGVIESVAERGYEETTVAEVVALAGVSRKTFYESFADKEECYRAAYEAGFKFLRECMARADGGGTRKGPVEVRLESLLQGLAAYPQLAAFFLISPLTVSAAVAKRHHECLQDLVGALIAEPAEPVEAADLRAQALAGALSELATMKVDAGDTGAIPSLLPDLLELFRIMAR
jgi:AcrR family transcriptional regulator